MNDLHGKVAVVLGASAEAGSGWAIAEALAEHGAKVVVGARSEAPLRVLADKIGGTAVVCDVGDEQQVEKVARTALEQYGGLDIAVNSAGRSVLKYISDCDDDDLQLTVQTNYYGNVYFVKHMAKAIGRDGSIVIVSSLSTTRPAVPNFTYACAKAATDCMVRYAALEYGPVNIRVNSLLPGPIVSDMTRELMSGPGVVETFQKEVPLGRLGYPRDYADATLWLAGQAYITGAQIPICGGMQLNRFPFVQEFPMADKAWDINPGTLYDRQQKDA
jgi:NAD(P)-dependent dehydrogenase (short-subunit alcohol dehydrogenase family)